MNHRVHINGARLWRTIEETAAFGGTQAGGICRLALTDEDKAARDWLFAASRDAGLAMAVDAIGNMFATRRCSDDRPAIAFGSHLDTQPTGGRFDGILGVLAGLEVMRTLAENGIPTRHPLTLVNWTNEEGVRFSPAVMCSGVYAGEVDGAPMMAGTDADGHRFDAELRRIGYAGVEPVGSRRFAAFLELHIEQGPQLEAAGETIGIVTGGQGIAWFDGTLTGRESHAGTTPMTLRRDALAAFAEIALAVEAIARAHGPAGVGTVGAATIAPGARNTVPGRVAYKAEFRHPDGAALTEMEGELTKRAAQIAARRGVDATLDRQWRKDPVVFDAGVVACVEEAARANGFAHRRMVSGAGHDAIYVAATCPAAMIFVPCEGGLSHNEAEAASPDDCAAGAQVLLDAVLALDAKL